ncbi:MAG: hypothetical protein ACREI9_13245, partial [Nitrospiraceae bacterium]
VKFVGDFRSGVADMLTRYKRVMELVAMADVIGWEEADYEGALSGSDITAAEFVEAITMLKSLTATFSAETGKLEKMLP